MSWTPIANSGKPLDRIVTLTMAKEFHADLTQVHDASVPRRPGSRRQIKDLFRANAQITPSEPKGDYQHA
jgi:hypothetical protein